MEPPPAGEIAAELLMDKIKPNGFKLNDGLVFVHDKEYRFFNPFLRAWLINKGY